MVEAELFHKNFYIFIEQYVCCNGLNLLNITFMHIHCSAFKGPTVPKYLCSMLTKKLIVLQPSLSSLLGEARCSIGMHVPFAHSFVLAIIVQNTAMAFLNVVYKSCDI